MSVSKNAACACDDSGHGRNSGASAGHLGVIGQGGGLVDKRGFCVIVG